MIQVVITKEELANALADLERLHARGFVASTAILKVAEVGESLGDTKLKYTNRCIMQASENDSWGSISSNIIDFYSFDNGILTYDPK
jgi:hypothetical protein